MTTRGIPDQYIENDRARRQTFTTLVRALEAKARALSTLCAVDVSISVVNGGEIRRTVWTGDSELRRTVIALDGQPSRISQEDAQPVQSAGFVSGGTRSEPVHGRDVMSQSMIGDVVSGGRGLCPIYEDDQSGPEPGNRLIHKTEQMQDRVDLLHRILGGDAAADGPFPPRLPHDPRADDRSNLLATPSSPDPTPPPLPPRRGDVAAHVTTPGHHVRPLVDPHCEDSITKSECYVSFPEQQLRQSITPCNRSNRIQLCQASNCTAPQCRDCPMLYALDRVPSNQLPEAISPGRNSGYDTGGWMKSSFTEGLPFPACARGTMTLTLPPPRQSIGRHVINGQIPVFNPRGAATESTSDVCESEHRRTQSPVPIRKFGAGVVKRRSKRLAEVDG